MKFQPRPRLAERPLCSRLESIVQNDKSSGALKPKSCALSQNGYRTAPGSLWNTWTLPKNSSSRSTWQMFFFETWQWKIQLVLKKPLLHEFKCICKIISTLSEVSGFNPFEKILLKMDHFCKDFWWKFTKICKKPPQVILDPSNHLAFISWKSQSLDFPKGPFAWGQAHLAVQGSYKA